MRKFTKQVRRRPKKRWNDKNKPKLKIKRKRNPPKPFVLDCASLEPKWKPYYALRDKHLRLFFSSSAI